MDDYYSEHEYHPYEDDLMEMSNNEAWADASSDMSEDESNEDNYDDEESDLDNRHLDPSRDDREPGYDDSDYPSNREW